MTVLEIYKGHGTRNDFVLLDDRDAKLDINESLVRTLTDRRDGVGGDGLIRLVPTVAMPQPDRDRLADSPQWFMDYRNADGSVAQMCGNGVRAFAAFLELLDIADCAAAPLAVGTRAGTKWVTKDSETGWYSVSMGPGTLSAPDAAREHGADATVKVTGLEGPPRPGLSVDMGNPHTVVALYSRAELEELDLTRAPEVLPQPSDGTNVEFVVPLSEIESDDGIVGRAVMRVHERGVGETPSCGTGACAVAVALATWGGPSAPQRWLIDVPGGQVSVDLNDLTDIRLAGPARIVARAQVFIAEPAAP